MADPKQIADALAQDQLLAQFNRNEAQAQPWYMKPIDMEGRATFLPFKDTLPGSVMNQRELALPGLLAGAVNAFTAPSRVSTQGFDAPEEALNLVTNVMGGGITTGKMMRNPTGGGGTDLFNSASKPIDTSYRGSHVAPNAERYGATLDNLGGIMPADVYSSKGISLYGINDPAIDREWFAAAYRAKNNPNYETTVWRAVPKGVKDINSGDWVTTSKTYAKNHGENTLNGEYDLISSKVKANTLTSEGYPYEFGYHQPTRKELLQQEFDKLDK
jgi:hypothetical protein